MTLTIEGVGRGSPPAFFAEVAGPFTAAVILIVGVGMALAGAPAISQNVMSFGKKLGLGVTKGGALTGGSAFWRKYGGKISKPAEKIGNAGQKIQAWGTKQRGLGRVVGMPAMLAGWGTKRAGKGIEIGGGVLKTKVTMKDVGEIAEAEKRAAQVGDSKLVANEFNKELLKGAAANRNRLVGLVNGMIKNGDADDLQEYITTGLMDGKMVGRAIIDGRDRIGPNGYRPIIKALGGMIYSDPTKLGWGVQKDASTGKALLDDYGSVKIQGKNAQETDFLENTVKREIVEKLSAAEITNQGILGNYIKNYHNPDWKPAADILVRRLVKERGADFLGAILRKPERREGRTQLGKFVQSYIDTHFESDPAKTRGIEDIPDEYLNSFASAAKYLYSSGAASAGIAGGYRGKSANEVNTKIRKVMEERGGTTPPGGTAGGPTPRTTQETIQNQIDQLIRREQELRSLIEQAQGPAAALDPNYQQTLPTWEQELSALLQSRTQLQNNLRDVLIQKIPDAPAPLPEIKLQTPKSLVERIEEGNRIIGEINRSRSTMERSLNSIRSTQAQIRDVEAEIIRARQELTGEQLAQQLSVLDASKKRLDEAAEGNREAAGRAREQILEQNEGIERVREDISRQEENQPRRRRRGV
ncbi:MAG: hypothetical protein Q7R48_02505 [bacterium]|nr:hypothetical protein [bacterium]